MYFYTYAKETSVVIKPWILFYLLFRTLWEVSSFPVVAFWNHCSKKQFFMVPKIVLYLHCIMMSILPVHGINESSFY